jgi:hypothetical protein
MVDMSNLYRDAPKKESKPKKNPTASRLSPDAPDVKWDDTPIYPDEFDAQFEDVPDPSLDLKKIEHIKKALADPNSKYWIYPTHVPSNDIDENTFLVWVKSLNPNEYPICNGIITRLQKYQRKSFILDVLRLVNVYLKGRS